MLTKILPKEHLQHLSSVKSWEDAIRITSLPLLQKGLIEEIYIENMIKNVYSHGPYIVLNDYFALPHAQPGVGVNEVGMALLTLDQPVDLEGKPVKIFLVLAAIDSESHLEALTEISSLLMDPKKYEIFLTGSIDDIYKLLKGGERA